MGYDFHITRRELWFDDQGPAISAEEWLRLLEEDPELELDRRNGPYFANCARPGEEDQWLDWSDGYIYTKNPADWFVRKMQRLAERLGAQVQGDEGEVYDGEYPPPDPQPPPADDRPWWEKAIGRVYWWVRPLTRRRPPIRNQVPFRVGDRVRHASGARGTVIRVDRWAEHGWGRMRVRLDDGQEQTAYMSVGMFDPLEQEED